MELLLRVNAKSIAMTINGSVVAVGVRQQVLVMNAESRLIL